MNDTTTQNHDSPPTATEPSTAVGYPECYGVDVTVTRPLATGGQRVAMMDGKATLRYVPDDESDEDEAEVGTVTFRVVDTNAMHFLDEADSVDQYLSGLVLPLFTSTGDLEQTVFDLTESGCPDRLLVVEYVTLDERHRGFGLGRMLLEATIREITREGDLVVLRAAPVLREGEVDSGPVWEAACQKLREHWFELGFRSPFPDDPGHMILDTQGAWGFDVESLEDE